MMFSSKTCRFALVLVAACNAVTSAVDIGSAKNYVILAKSGISTVPDSDITGDIAVSPVDAATITGFSLVADSGGTFSTSSQLSGESKGFAANYAPPIPTQLTTVVSETETAYANAEGLPNTDAARINIGGGALGGVNGDADSPLTPGVYTFGTGVNIAESISFEGNDTAVFTIQLTKNLEQAANTQVILTGGALVKNVFWQVAG
jgi:hypothetical protein